jgi:two-component system nitrate/nitrite sensor histidine kinase NarX
MFHWFKSSLPARAGLAVILISTLALASTISAGLMAWVTEKDAAAINTAGSLRMATYRLSWKLEARAADSIIQTLQHDLEQRLHSPALFRLVQRDDQSLLRQSFTALENNWEEHLKPALKAQQPVVFQQQADIFVEQLDRFVMLLQHQSERRQIWQQAIQGAALISIVIILLIGMYELFSSVITPLQELVGATERFRAGQFDARINYRSDDELGQMAVSFNAMAEAIEDSHRTLESRVEQKTQSLAQANAALELLYQSSRNLAGSAANADQLNALIDSFQQRLPGLRLTLCLRGHALEPADHLIALHGNQSREICSRNDCASCERHHAGQLQTYLISNQGNTLGELRARYLDGRLPHPWEERLIEALCNLIGTSLSLERQREQDHRLLLLEERAIIARELHDSLAQALSYMRLQVSRLQALIRRGEPVDRLEQVSEEIRDGLNSAYRQLRELLTTFRLRIQEGGLEQALDDTVKEFAERGGFEVLLERTSLAFTLAANEQIHLLQIVREALSNCARHAHARRVWVRLEQQAENIHLCIEDDGCGIDPDFDSRQHYGLTIMQERASSLRGQLSIQPRHPNGTRVELVFAPHFLGHHAVQELS